MGPVWCVRCPASKAYTVFFCTQPNWDVGQSAGTRSPEGRSAQWHRLAGHLLWDPVVAFLLNPTSPTSLVSTGSDPRAHTLSPECREEVTTPGTGRDPNIPGRLFRWCAVSRRHCLGTQGPGCSLRNNSVPSPNPPWARFQAPRTQLQSDSQGRFLPSGKENIGEDSRRGWVRGPRGQPGRPNGGSESGQERGTGWLTRDGPKGLTALFPGHNLYRGWEGWGGTAG